MPLSFKQTSLNNNKISTILDYKPNFVIVSNSNNSTSGYLANSSTANEQSNALAINFVKLYTNFLNIFICLVNFVTQTHNYLVYKTFKLLKSTYYSLHNIPTLYYNTIEGTQDFISTFSFTDTRELWWLERKIDIRNAVKLFQSTTQIGWRIMQKFYLSFVVFIALAVLNSGGTGFLSNTSNSFVSRFLQDHTPFQSEPVVFSSTVINAAAVGLENQAPIVSIIEHTVIEGETIDTLANIYGISTDTINFNNTIDNNTVKVGQKIYIPWIDGYIYRTSSDTTPAQIEEIYGVPADQISKENKAILNPETNKFAKDSLVLIPIKDFGKITAVNNAISAEAKRIEEEARRKLLATQSISNITSYSPSGAANSGFIWPTSGVISRCVQAGHVACDIANASAPNVVSVQDGVVSAVYRYSVYGYGLAVVVDHGNGLKTLYAHFSQIYVNQGQTVSQGTALGRMGCTGLCTGTHLHFEVKRNNVNQNPLLYLP